MPPPLTLPSPYRMLAALALTLAALTWTTAARAEGDEGGIRWTNGLKTDELLFNALTANPVANPRMVQEPLRSDRYDDVGGHPELRWQLRDPYARSFMRYLVSCALGPGQKVQWKEPSGFVHEWEGRIGLCPAWANGPASLECQHWVSACVAARNNALGKRVMLSARGNKPATPAIFTPLPAVKTDPYILYTRERVASARPCTLADAATGLRDCDFRMEHLGQCVPGSWVNAGAGGWPVSCSDPAVGATVAGHVMLRACDGLTTCNGAAALAESTGTCGTTLPAVRFLCPASGVFSLSSASYYNSAYYSGATSQAEVAVTGASYPAPEADLFSQKEGAFYGLMFGAGTLAEGLNVRVTENGEILREIPQPTAQVPRIVIYPKMYSCQAASWSNAEAYDAERLCTVSGQHCAAKPLGKCNAFVESSTTVRRCALNNVTGYGDNGQCLGASGDVHQQVVTTYLNQPCDIVGSSSNNCGLAP